MTKLRDGYCQARVRTSHSWRRPQCARKAVVDGVWCKQHDPKAVAAREAQRQAEWQRQHDANRAEAAKKRAAAAEQARRAACFDDLVEALEPFAAFVKALDAKPLRNMADELYGIHAGTEWEASIRISHCRAARAALERARGGDDAKVD